MLQCQAGQLECWQQLPNSHWTEEAGKRAKPLLVRTKECGVFHFRTQYPLSVLNIIVILLR